MSYTRWMTLKSPRMTIKCGFLFVILFKLSSKLSANFLKMSYDWPGERYKETKLHNVLPNDISKFMQSSKSQTSNTLKTRECL